MTNQCTCFVKAGEPQQPKGCPVHPDGTRYRCEFNGCLDYRPIRDSSVALGWARCMCGVIAQDHDNTPVEDWQDMAQALYTRRED